MLLTGPGITHSSWHHSKPTPMQEVTHELPPCSPLHSFQAAGRSGNSLHSWMVSGSPRACYSFPYCWGGILESCQFLYIKLFYFTCMSIYYICMSVHHVCAVPAEVREELEFLELESQTTVSSHVGAGSQTLCSGGADSALPQGAISQDPLPTCCSLRNVTFCHLPSVMGLPVPPRGNVSTQKKLL